MSVKAMMGSLIRLALPGYEDRAALARLRRAEKEGGWLEAYRYVLPYVEEGGEVKDYLLVASLFGHSQKTSNDSRWNIGSVCRLLKDAESEAAADRRFAYLLGCDRQGLESELFRIAKKSARKGVAINFVDLFNDLRAWGDGNQAVQLKWAREYFINDRSQETAEVIIENKED
jgi:CRISPR type I-E-associated protein CasB/Cse2